MIILSPASIVVLLGKHTVNRGSITVGRLCIVSLKLQMRAGKATREFDKFSLGYTMGFLPYVIKLKAGMGTGFPLALLTVFLYACETFFCPLCSIGERNNGYSAFL